MKKVMWKIIINNYYKSAFIILASAFFIRLIYFFIFPGSLSNDAQSYYIAAINIVNGIGYSDHIEAPFLPFYFREPLTSYSIALVAGIIKFISGINNIDYPISWSVSEMQPIHQSIILVVRVISSLLQIIGIYLFSILVKKYASKEFSLIFLILCSISIPLIIYSSLVLREVYVFFLLMLITYLWERFITTDSRMYFYTTAFFAGLACMYLHLYWLLLLFYVPFIVIHYWRKKNQILGRIIVFVFLFFLPSMPWVYRVYQYYPDIRVAKTLGSALTVDYTNALNAYRAHGVDPYYVKQGDIPGDVKINTEIFSIRDSRLNFQYAFDGTYQREAARLNAANTTKRIVNYYIYRIGLAFRNTVFIVGLTYNYELFFGDFSLKEIAKFMICLPNLLLGILALFGLWSVLKRHWLFMPVFLYHALFFFAYGDEERRQYVLVPWIIVMALYSIWILFKRIKE